MILDTRNAGFKAPQMAAGLAAVIGAALPCGAFRRGGRRR